MRMDACVVYRLDARPTRFAVLEKILVEAAGNGREGVDNVTHGNGAIDVRLLIIDVWILLIGILPVIGLIAWFLAGPRGARAVA